MKNKLVKSEETIKTEIREYIRENDGVYLAWYVGIAEDPRKRLFEDHNVDEKNDLWIYRRCENSAVARRIEEYFISLGTDGGTSGGSYDSVYVYAYKKTTHSRE